MYPSNPPLYFSLSLFTSDLLSWKNMPIYWDDQWARMENLFSISTTHNSSWVDVRSVLTTLFIEEERRMVPEKAREEADTLHVAVLAILPKQQQQMQSPSQIQGGT